MRKTLICLVILCLSLGAAEAAHARKIKRRYIDKWERTSMEHASDAVSYKVADTFDVPVQLIPAVRFWEKVYTQYTTKQSLIHDNKYLQVVYSVADFSDLFANPRLDERDKRRLREDKSEELKAYYQRILARLERVDAEEIAVSALDDEELRVYRLFSNINEEYRFSQAQQRLRAQVGQKNEFTRGVVDSGGFLAEMEEIFRSYRLPPQLTRLTFVESMFNTKAYSKAQASGIWQFIPVTGKLYLRIDNLIDERNDPILATHAAARLLLANFRALGSWPLALTAYNHGVSGMKTAVRRTGETDLGAIVASYRSASFGFASRNFYAQFLAAVQVEQNYQKYFGALKRDPPVTVDTLRIPEHVSLRTLCEYCRIPEDKLIELNPALTDMVMNSLAFIPPDYDLKIPRGQKEKFLIAYANIPRTERHQLQHVFQWHRVLAGESLSQIARHYRVAPGVLLRANNLSSPNRIYVGKLLKIPGKEIVLAKNLKGQNTKGKLFVEAGRAPKAVVNYPEVRIVPLEKPKEPVVATHMTDAPTESILPSSTESPTLEAETSTAGLSAGAPLTTKEWPEAPIKSLATPPPEQKVFLFAALDPRNNDADFSGGSRKMAPPADLGWTFRYETEANDPSGKGLHAFTFVTDGETPGHFSEWCSISTPQFRRLNKLKFGESISLGQRIRLECPVDQATFQERRLAHHRKLQDEFLKECPTAETQTHRVKSEESLWQLANEQYRIPVWLIQRFNPDKDLTKGIVAGTDLVIPHCEAVAQVPKNP